MVTHHSATSKQKSKAHFQALKALQKSKMCQLEGGIIRKVSEMLLDGIAYKILVPPGHLSLEWTLTTELQKDNYNLDQD
ncbi:hypothetical protein RIR_jg1710.t1 [Rhizophagus irregularis DAOM 181602=DAOM 197198]|uniref:Uncharacterized protein n=1 Tax=Rhizophagus irregularis (strain DAOM 197198w) TaxID=1432141 RepID=A0A015LKM1_RHIIW|nr:hypothetical protein RirG_226260 [Rhizophagus irregularis DAOM 197198w]GBC18239.1 hypothetical protein RIR_jg1710.t1 [Rhizophagus irregularis DAOM 181602=DAOM 197198]